MITTKPQSVADAALRAAALATATAFLALTALVTFLSFSKLREQRLAQIISFSEERTARELSVFREAQDILRSLQADVEARAADLSEEEARAGLFVRTAGDGTGGLRSPLVGPESSRRAQLFLPDATAMPGPNLRVALAAAELLDRYGPALRALVPNAYYIGDEGESVIYWHEHPMVNELKPGKGLLSAAPYLLATPAVNRSGRPGWTNVYVDQTSHQAVVSVSLPLRLDGEFVGAIAQDLFLDALIERTQRLAPQGATTAILSREGRLIAHPAFEDQLRNGASGAHLHDLGDPALDDLYALALANVQVGQPTAVHDGKHDRYLVIGELPGPGWLLVTSFGARALLQEAMESALLVLVLGALCILAEVIVLRAVMERMVAQPLHLLADTTRRWRTERSVGALQEQTDRPDEVGQLARDFCDLHAVITEQVDHLEAEIAQRRLATAALEEIQQHLRDEVESATAELQFANLQLSQLALFDSLTGLANRQNYEDTLRRAIEEQQLTGGNLALMFIDLDGFKAVNDQFGHETGDVLLHQIAHRLVRAVRAYEVVARLGGDEFVVVLRHLGDRGALVSVAERILAACREPAVVGGITLRVSASLGVAIFPDDVADPAASDAAARLQQSADLAMYEAKRRGKATWSFFDRRLTDQALAEHRLHDDLRAAVLDDQFVVYFQPIWNVRRGAIAGLEALVRWQHPTRGLLTPDAFIPAAERSHLIAEVDRCVVRQVVRRLAACWRRLPPELYVALNFSAQTLVQGAAVSELGDLLRQTGLPPRWVAVEVTESSFVEEGPAIQAVLALQAEGVRVILDDFGVGYSSLSYLKRIPISAIKLDRAFVRDVHEDGHSQAITRAVLTLARALGVTVVAEGAENPRQVDFLRGEGCDLFQGYFFGEPAPAAEVLARLTQGGEARAG